jgi:hypothetical protein
VEIPSFWARPRTSHHAPVEVRHRVRHRLRVATILARLPALEADGVGQLPLACVTTFPALAAPVNRGIREKVAGDRTMHAIFEVAGYVTLAALELALALRLLLRLSCHPRRAFILRQSALMLGGAVYLDFTCRAQIVDFVSELSPVGLVGIVGLGAFAVFGATAVLDARHKPASLAEERHR